MSFYPTLSQRRHFRLKGIAAVLCLAFGAFTGAVLADTIAIRPAASMGVSAVSVTPLRVVSGTLCGGADGTCVQGWQDVR